MLTTPAAGRGITIAVTGDRMVLPSREATSLSMATSELVQNAVEHAFAGRDNGQILVQLEAATGECAVIVQDDGVGNALATSSTKGLGLQIVEALVHDDLQGRFELVASPAGTQAIIRFPNPAGPGAKS